MVIGASGGSGFFLIIIVAFVFLWLIVVRPQRRKQNQQRQMLNDLRVGDDVLTAGGIYGTITHIEEDRVTVEIAPQLEVRVARRAIAGVTREPEPDEQDAGEEADEARGPVLGPPGQAPSSVGRESSAEENRG